MLYRTDIQEQITDAEILEHWPPSELQSALKWQYTSGYSGWAALRREWCGMSAESQNCEANRDSPLLGNGSIVFMKVLQHLEVMLSMWSVPKLCLCDSTWLIREGAIK
jgi:hypothetical protein